MADISKEDLRKNFLKGKAAAYRAWGIRYNQFMMSLEMVHGIGIWLIIGWVLLFGFSSLVFLGYSGLKQMGIFLIAKLMTKSGAGGIQFIGGYSAAKVVHAMADDGWWLTIKFSIIGIFCGSIFLSVFPILKYLKKKGLEDMQDVWLEGSKLNTVEETNRLVIATNKRADLPLCEVRLLFELEKQHIGAYGQTGAGKTQVLNPIVKAILARGDRMVIHDVKPDYTPAYYDEKNSLIFNVLDDRHMKPFGGWALFNEIRTVMDVVTVANSIIPEGTDRDKFFNLAARHVLVGILFHCFYTGQTLNRDIWRVVSKPVEDVALILKTTKGGEKGYSYISNPTTPLAGSVKAVLMQYMTCFEFMQEPEGAERGTFCIRDWVRDEKTPYRTIFVSNHEEISETLKPVISLFFDLVASNVNSLSEDTNRRLFLVIDELDSLNQLSSLIKFLTKARSKGGVLIFTIQTVSQLETHYGKPGRSTIIGNHATSIILRVTEPETAKYLSDKIGEIKKIKTEESYVLKNTDQGEGVTLSRREVTEPLVIPSVIMNLQNLECYVTMPGFSTTLTKATYGPMPVVSEAFVMRPGFSLEEFAELELKQKTANDTAAALKGAFMAEVDKERRRIEGTEEPEKTSTEPPSQEKEEETIQSNITQNIVDDYGSYT